MQRAWALGLLALTQASCVVLTPTGPGAPDLGAGPAAAEGPTRPSGGDRPGLDSGPAAPGAPAGPGAPGATTPAPPFGPAAPPQVGVGLVSADGGEALPTETYPYPTEEAWSPELILGMLNEVRQKAGLKPVRLSEEHSRGAMAHAKYMVINYGHPLLEGLKAHEAQPSLPGYTEEGAIAAATGDLSFGGGPVHAFRSWRDTYYHRMPMLYPSLVSVGFGHHDDGKERCSVLSFQYGSEEGTPPAVVVYPGHQQEGVLWDFSPEIPDPLPPGATEAGYPVTLAFTGGWSFVQASLRRASGEALPCHVYHKDAMPPAGDPGNSLALIPKAPLDDDQAYQVEVDWKDEAGQLRQHRSGFRTAALPVVRSLAEAPRWVNQKVWVEGTVGAVGRTDFPGLPSIPKIYLARKAGEPQFSFFVREEWLRYWPPESQWVGMKVRMMGDISGGGTGTLALITQPSWRSVPPTAPDPLN